jgi:hypothetical protein
MKDESFYPGNDTDTGTASSPGNDDTSTLGSHDAGGIEGAEGHSDTNEEGGHVVMASEEGAPKPNASHPGFADPSCMALSCHGSTNANVETSAKCAECHGRNGSPSCGAGNRSYCLSCHTPPHDESVGSVESDCIVCHVE